MTVTSGKDGVSCTITNNGNGTRTISWRFSMLKLDSAVNGSANETWVSYMGANSTSTAGTETATTTAMTDNGDGTCSYRFTKVINGGIASVGTVYEPASRIAS